MVELVTAILSFLAALFSLAAVVKGNQIEKQVGHLEARLQRISQSPVSGTQTASGDGNVQVGGHFNG